MKNFNDLFDEFFNRKKKEEPRETPPTNPMHDAILKIIDSLNSFSQVPSASMDELDNTFGEPTSIEEGSKDGLHFKKYTWETPHGKFVKVVISDQNAEDAESVVSSLEQKLEEAINAEDYELAIELRDKIAKESQPKKSSKKS